MGMKKLLNNLKTTLGINLSKEDIKKDSMEQLIKKLADKLQKTKKRFKKSSSKKEKQELLEQKELIKLQIKKAHKVLKKLKK